MILCLLAATAFTRADDPPFVELQIRLVVVESDIAHWQVCKVNDNWFHLSSALLKRKVVITAENGVSIYFPYQAHQCRPVKDWLK